MPYPHFINFYFFKHLNPIFVIISHLRYFTTILTFISPQAPHRSETMQELSQQFRAALIGYDEGLQGSDMVLAAALWRRLLARRKDATAQQLETLVAYVRRQVRAPLNYTRGGRIYCHSTAERCGSTVSSCEF